MQELLEVKTRFTTRYFIVEPVSKLLKEPAVRVYDEDGNYFEDFDSWNDMRKQFEQRGWEIIDHCVWSLEGTYIGHILATR